MSHTKGKWKWDRRWEKDASDNQYDGSIGCLTTENKTILWYGMDGEENIYCPNEADACLIAAAPALLAACERDAELATAAILATPTGKYRNKLTEINILRLQAIAEAKK